MEKVLQGIRVLDFSRYAAGPYGAMLLADMGAEVIRVEPPGGGEDRALGPLAPNGEAIVFGMILARNKKGITLNLRSDAGKELLKELVRRSDVVLHNFTSGAPEARLLSYEALKEVNPGIIAVSISGFGNTGPYTQRPCFDSIAQALSGAMSYTGFPGSPPLRAAVAYVDFSTGVYVALGTMFALYYRQRTGEGQGVDLALLDTAVSFVAGLGTASEVKLLNFVRQPIGNYSFYTYSNTFPTRDGWVMVNVIGEPLWKRFVQLLDKPELAEDPRFQGDMNRFHNRELITAIVSPWMAERSTAEVVRLLEEARVPCGKVNTVAEMVADPQVQAREMLVELEYPEVGKVPMPGVVPKLSRSPGKVEQRAPRVGEHNEQIYCGLLGLSPAEFARLQEEGVI
jgi:CoA:oxalate CoA-transferase